MQMRTRIPLDGVSVGSMTAMLAALTAPLAAVGGACLNTLKEFGRIAIFFARAVLGIFSLPLQIAKFVSQVSIIGARSVLVICLTGAFTGMVLGLQGYYTLVKFGAQGMLGAAVALSLIREMGPVLTAIMITARAGSAMSAEIGIMRISEEIDALKTMDINPIRFLVSPRIVAAVISFPLLTAIFDVIGIFGGYVSGSVLLGLSSGIFFSRVESSVEMVRTSAAGSSSRSSSPWWSRRSAATRGTTRTPAPRASGPRASAPPRRRRSSSAA